MKTLSLRFLSAGFAALLAIAAQAQTYPVKPVRMIVPFGPGGAADFVARIVQPTLSEILGQQVVVDNRGGAAGNIGVEIAARARADGYTLLLGNISTMAVNPSVFPTFPVKPLRDFTSVTMLTEFPGALGVHASLPVSSINEFIHYAKAREGRLSYGSTGAGSAQRMTFELFMREAGIRLVHVPYSRGAGAAMTAVLSQEVQATILTTATVIPHARTGRIRILGVIASKRSPQLPDVPTLAELGFPAFTIGSWQGIYLPARTPKPIVSKLFAATMNVLSDHAVRERLTSGGALVLPSKSPADFAAFMIAQNEVWAKTVQAVGDAVTK